MRTLPGILPGQKATLEVRVWDGSIYPTFEAARTAGGMWGISGPFDYTVPPDSSPSVAYYMENFRGFMAICRSYPPPGGVVDFNNDVPFVTRADRLVRDGFGEDNNIDGYVRKLEEELSSINSKHLGPDALKRFSDQLYEDHSSFILGTGFQLRIDEETQGIEVYYVDTGENIRKLEILSSQYSMKKISDLPTGQLEELDQLFRNLEGFHQSYRKLISHDATGIKVPERQKRWFKKAEVLRETLRSNFIEVIFKPENIHSDLEILHHRAPSLLQFLLPEFVSESCPRWPARRSTNVTAARGDQAEDHLRYFHKGRYPDQEDKPSLLR